MACDCDDCTGETVKRELREKIRCLELQNCAYRDALGDIFKIAPVGSVEWEIASMISLTPEEVAKRQAARTETRVCDYTESGVCDYTESGGLVVCKRPLPCPDHRTKEEAYKIIEEAGFSSGVKPVAKKRVSENNAKCGRGPCEKCGQADAWVHRCVTCYPLGG